jgi:arylsulfatase A-like enzyme
MDKGAGPGLAGPLATGAAIGALAGTLEVLLQLGHAGSAIQRAHLFEAALLYGLAGGLAGGLLLLLALALLRRPPSIAFVGAFVASLFLFLIAGGFVNVRFLPGAMSRTSLLVTGGILLGALVLGRVAYILLRLLRWQGVRVRPQNRAGRFTLLALTVLAPLALALISYLPSPRHSAQTRAGGAGGGAAGAGAGRGLNVLLLVVDALRFDHLSMNGYERETSPAIDALARSGIAFENAGAQSSWTKPSTATILTGRYPAVHHMNTMASGVPESIELLPEMLHRAGYRTALITANNFVTPVFGFGRGVDEFYASNPPRFFQLMLGHVLSRLREWSRLAAGVTGALQSVERAFVGGGTPAGGLRAEGLTRALLDWLDRDPAGTPSGTQPFFAYMHFMDAHAPYSPPAPYDTRFMTPAIAALPPVTDHPTYTGFLPFETGRAVSADSLSSMVALYDGGIRYLDDQLARLFDELKQRGLYDNTLIILTADHGEEFHERGGWGHGHSLFEELVHVPLVMSCPAGVVPLGDYAGRRYAQPVRHVDLVPTILELCGLGAPATPAAGESSGPVAQPFTAGTDGKSLVPILTGLEPPDPPRPVYSELDHGGRFAHALRIGPEKAMFCQRGTDRKLFLFDLATDPGERSDLAPQDETRAARAEARLNEFRSSISSGDVQEVRVTLDEATRERLRALGYLR